VSKPITGPAIDDLTVQWLDGAIPADHYLRQARRLARESARRDLLEQDRRRVTGTGHRPASPAEPQALSG
jgi:hypothetical protein